MDQFPDVIVHITSEERLWRDVLSRYVMTSTCSPKPSAIVCAVQMFEGASADFALKDAVAIFRRQWELPRRVKNLWLRLVATRTACTEESSTGGRYCGFRTRWWLSTNGCWSAATCRKQSIGEWALC